MDQTTSRAVGAILEQASFYAELMSIIIAAFLGAVLVLLLHRLRRAGFSKFTLVVTGVIGMIAAFISSGITAYYIFDRVYIPFVIDPPPSVGPHSFLPVWVYPSFSRLAVIISTLASALFTFLCLRNNNQHGSTNAEQLIRADTASGPR